MAAVEFDCRGREPLNVLLLWQKGSLLAEVVPRDLVGKSDAAKVTGAMPHWVTSSMIRRS